MTETSLEIFLNNGSSFQPHQVLELGSKPNQLTVAPSSKVYVLCDDGLKSIEEDGNGTFSSSILLPLLNSFLYFLISPDEELLVFGGDLLVDIYVWNGAHYSLNQTLTKGIYGDGLALSSDGKELVLCQTSLSIYRHDGASFVLTQTIDLGFACLATYFLD